MLKHVVDLGIPAGIFVLMLIAGTEMAVRDFVLLAKHPRPVLTDGECCAECCAECYRLCYPEAEFKSPINARPTRVWSWLAQHI